MSDTLENSLKALEKIYEVPLDPDRLVPSRRPIDNITPALHKIHKELTDIDHNALRGLLVAREGHDEKDEWYDFAFERAPNTLKHVEYLLKGKGYSIEVWKTFLKLNDTMLKLKDAVKPVSDKYISEIVSPFCDALICDQIDIFRPITEYWLLDAFGNKLLAQLVLSLRGEQIAFKTLEYLRSRASKLLQHMTIVFAGYLYLEARYELNKSPLGGHGRSFLEDMRSTLQDICMTVFGHGKANSQINPRLDPLMFNILNHILPKSQEFWSKALCDKSDDHQTSAMPQLHSITSNSQLIQELLLSPKQSMDLAKSEIEAADGPKQEESETGLAGGCGQEESETEAADGYEQEDAAGQKELKTEAAAPLSAFET